MEMTMRWYGKEYDTVTLQQIRQSCYVKGIISTLYNKMPSDVPNNPHINQIYAC